MLLTAFAINDIKGLSPRSADVSSTKEQTDLLRTDGMRPDAVALALLVAGKYMPQDATLVHTCVPFHLSKRTISDSVTGGNT